MRREAVDEAEHLLGVQLDVGSDDVGENEPNADHQIARAGRGQLVDQRSQLVRGRRRVGQQVEVELPLRSLCGIQRRCMEGTLESGRIGDQADRVIRLGAGRAGGRSSQTAEQQGDDGKQY